MAKNSLKDFMRMKREGKKVTWITSYDAQTSRLAEEVGMDMLLVGDSAGNNLLGYENTIPVTMEEMIMLSKAVRRGAPNTFVIGDMPLGSYQASNMDAVNNAIRFLKEAGMDSIKCEGGVRIYNRVKAMKDAGIAVTGHIGFTPQSTDLEGVVQSKSLSNFKSLLADAESLQEAGAWSILLEAVPNKPAGLIAKHLRIPVYGIGAGRETDGVLAIVNDVIGLGGMPLKFKKQYCDVDGVVRNAFKGYISEIQTKNFPSDTHCYSINDENLNEITEYVKNLKNN